MTTSTSGGGEDVTGDKDTQDDSWLADQAHDALSAIATLYEQAKATFTGLGHPGEAAEQDTDGPADAADAKPAASETHPGWFTTKAEAPGGQPPCE
ncbi:hypothetical protein FHX82_001815 [Amycolatopsis bartoniae]|uniref:Uncharacterized protein n=1 Tax=Amycolatopsis bartoniae TaxID=941986 RepID=A0A8H9ISA2_9PSEU|nr:hypothetical protein [Amycolatopsis bartoniae]MBB2934795.1 hypothetical protein [Amycolatopsis bartoniae]TVT02419.1 hypothetical protein FNH07_27275 [Amycolatopsis bartoniae]GHF44677.1 hypothetical protein GCM10017566_17110 [Amycolatopsis bartoniae]